MNNGGGRRIADHFFLVLQPWFYLWQHTAVPALRKSIQSGGADNPTFVSRSFDQRLATFWIGILCQDLGGSGTHRRSVVLGQRLERAHPDTGERDKPNALLEPELRHLLRIFEHLFLIVHQSAAAFLFA